MEGDRKEVEEPIKKNKDDDSGDKAGSNISGKSIKQFLINRVTGGYKEKWKVAITIMLFISIQFFIVYSALWTIPETKARVVCIQKLTNDCAFVMDMADVCYMKGINSTYEQSIAR